MEAPLPAQPSVARVPHDWRGDELSAFKAQPLPLGKEPIAQALEDVRGLRRDHPGPYATIAAAIETELQVQERIAKERPGVLGAIDTFPCEESLLHYNYMMEK
jgi:hypothetical protein